MGYNGRVQIPCEQLTYLSTDGDLCWCDMWEFNPLVSSCKEHTSNTELCERVIGTYDYCIQSKSSC